jgi:hypothetical protein
MSAMPHHHFSSYGRFGKVKKEDSFSMLPVHEKCEFMENFDGWQYILLEKVIIIVPVNRYFYTHKKLEQSTKVVITILALFILLF